jgi:ATP-binding cassette subfamily B multidrug efflux pump
MVDLRASYPDSPPVRLSRQLVDLVRPWSLRLAAVGGCVIGAAMLALVPPLVVRHVIDHDLIASHTNGLASAGVLYVSAIAASAMLTAAYGYLAATVAQRSLAELRARLFAHLLELPTSYHDRTPIGDSISRATADVEAIDDLFSSSVATLVGQTVGLITATTAMLVLSPKLTGVAAFVLAPVLIITRVLRRRIRAAERETRAAVGLLNAQLAEDLAAVEIVRAFGRQSAFANRFRHALQRWLRATNESVRYSAFYAPLLAIVSAVFTALLLWLGAGSRFDALGVSVGTLTAFVLLFSQFFTPLVNLGDEWQSVQAALAGAERVFAIVNLPADRPVQARYGTPLGDKTNGDTSLTDATPAGVARVDAARGDAEYSALSLREVSFGYVPGHAVLSSISLDVKPGEHVAIIGRTGAGKSSVLALLAGLYPPWTGRAELAGEDPRTLDEQARRALIGFVPQSVALFPGTVKDNITLGDPTVRFGDVERAAQIAGADSFIGLLPQGYETVLSDSGRGGGVQLSAGQRQLLALTRALVMSPAVLLLDEATAVIDGASDAAFRSALRQRILPTGTAVLTVAHRLATAREADRVIVIASGRIVEQGVPASLADAGGVFADLLALEAAGWDWQHDTGEALESQLLSDEA